jgi:iron complex outermembrane receptor protein
MKQIIFGLSIVASSLLYADSVNLGNIDVIESYEKEGFFVNDTNTTEAKQTFSSNGIQTLSNQSGINPYSVIQYAPSVNFTPTDQAGSNESSYHDPLRIRGKSQSGPGGVFMINATPISSNPGGGKQMIDVENMASIDLYKGYIPVAKNLGFSSLIGKVDINLLDPSDAFGTTFSQSLGSNNLNRSFIRVDSGKMGDFKAFGSFSYLGNEKHKGKGDLERTNATLGLAYKPNDLFESKLFIIKNSDDHHNYYALSYDEASDLGTYYDKDFGTVLSGSDNDVDYYDYNKQDFDTLAIIGEASYTPDADNCFTLRPYYKKDKGNYWFSKFDSTAAKQRVMNWRINHDLIGATAEYEHTFSQALKAKVGYWYHKQTPPGPPNNQIKYRVVGGNLIYDGYGVLSVNGDHILQAPFIEFSGEIDKFSYVFGLQYQSFKIGSLASYTNGAGTNATSIDYDTAISNGTIDPWASVDSKTFYTFIPSLYLDYKLGGDSNVYLDYSRTYGFDVNLFPTYIKNRASFVAQNVTLQQLWDDLELELSDNVELGVKTKIGDISIEPNVFVSFVKNKQANIYDTSLGVNYPANVGDALGYGAELSAYGKITDNLNFMGSLSYNKFHFTQDFDGAGGTTVETDGKQLPDAPKYLAKLALSYQKAGWTFTPSMQYTSSRWGDAANTQKIGGFTVFDLDVSYKLENFLGSKESIISLGATNLTDKEYISTIIAADNFLAATGTASTYLTGEPRGVYCNLTMKF